MVEIRPIEPGEAKLFQPSEVGAARSLWETEHPQVLRLGAWRGDTPVGLCAGVLAGKPVHTEVKWLWVSPLYRRNGVGTRLLAAMEGASRAHGAHWIQGLAPECSENSMALYRLLNRSGWEQHKLARVVYKLAYRLIGNDSWVYRVRRWPAGFELFPWIELKTEERHRMIQHWHDPQQFDPVLNPFERETQITSNSLGLRVKGEVAGWCVSWSLGSGPDERRTASGARLFVRPALRQRGLAVMLLGEYLSRMPEAGLDYLIFSIFPENELMLRVLKKRLRPFLTGTREIWEVRKTFLQPFPPSSTPITCPVGAREE